MQVEPIQFVLASASPRRRQLLEGAGYRFRIVTPDVEESPPASGVSPADYIEQLALAKASHVAQGCTGQWVLGADTVVVLDGRIIGKPTDTSAARRMLRELSGTQHCVMTGVALVEADSGQSIVDHSVTLVAMRRMAEAEIEQYVASGESSGKAGAYAIQESGDRFVTVLEGSFSNVVGLPLKLVHRLGVQAGLWD